MGSGGWEQSGDGSETENVIRLPRSWYGSREDLVPLGLAADELEADDAARGGTADPSASGGLRALSADDFWGEGSEALHQPVEAATPEPGADLGADAVMSAWRSGSTQWRGPGRFRSRIAAVGVRWMVLAACAVAVAVLGLLGRTVFAPGSGAGRGSSVARVSASRSAATAPMGRVRTSATGEGLDVVSAGLIHSAETLIEHSRARARDAARRSTARRARHRKRTSTITRSSSVVPAEAEAAASSEPPTAAATGGSDGVSDGDVAAGSVASSSAAAPTPRPTSASDDRSTGSSASSGQTSLSDLGGVVGPDCNPTCQ